MAPACGALVPGLWAVGAGLLCLWHRRAVFSQTCSTIDSVSPIPGAGLQVFCRRSAEMPQTCSRNRPLGTYDGTGLQGFSRLAPRASHSSSVFGRFCLSSGSVKPPIKHFCPFLLIVWLGRATHQAFSAVFAYRLARSCHSSSVFGRFCLSSGSVMPPIKHFCPFLPFMWSLIQEAWLSLR